MERTKQLSDHNTVITTTSSSRDNKNSENLLREVEENLFQCRHLISCAICLEIFIHPQIIMTCKHIFCQQCLEKLISKDKNIKKNEDNLLSHNNNTNSKIIAGKKKIKKNSFSHNNNKEVVTKLY